MSSRLLLPCLRGAIGDWVTYTCLMRLKEIVELVSFAEDIHKSKKLSKLIQRELKKDRQKDIGEYLLTEPEAFFNSLVVAIYDGAPRWHQFDTINGEKEETKNYETPDYAAECLGYLSITKKEKMFAIDGQHRLSGIQYAIQKDPDIGYQQIPVTFIPHFNDDAGLKRTRRLFTTLNKKAKPVNRAAVISLDEDDLSACATRYLVEETDLFNENRIKFQANNSVSYSDDGILTTIGNLYDVVRHLLQYGLGIEKKLIDNYRGTETEKNKIFDLIVDVFTYLFNKIPALNEYHLAENKTIITKKYRRKEDGGLFIFRPIGLKIYIIALCRYSSVKKRNGDSFENSAKEFINATYDIDFRMETPLFINKLWDINEKKILALKADHRDDIINFFLSKTHLKKQ
ncbi:MAG: DGQHR domain-containing protein [Aeromonadaceae bacterium]